MRFVIVVAVDIDEEDLRMSNIHIKDSFGNSVNYGDGNYGDGFTKFGLVGSFRDYVLGLNVFKKYYE